MIGNQKSDQMTVNERRILTLLHHHESLPKIDLAKKGHMGWATVVKMVNRLLNDGLIVHSGVAVERNKRGKNAICYSLSMEKPLAIGIDMEYRITKIVLTNLSGVFLAQETHETPQNSDPKSLKAFFEKIISTFIKKNGINLNSLAGIGIGLPGIGVPARVEKENGFDRKILSQYLTDVFHTIVYVEINVRAYTHYLRWDRQFFPREDFVLVSIRTGFGSGIILNGELFEGKQNYAGEIGHIKVVEDGLPCRCGHKGCLETIMNQNYLYNRYRVEVLQKRKRKNPSREEIAQGLSDLFSKAEVGHKGALNIVEHMANYLGQALSNLLLILNIPNIIISGYFGETGDVIVKPIENEIKKRLLSQIRFSIRYLPYKDVGFTRGAALLILKEYLTDIPT